MIQLFIIASICTLTDSYSHKSFQLINNKRIALTQTTKQYKTELSMSSPLPDDNTLMDQMKTVLGETEDVFADTDKESKQLLKGLREIDRDPNIRANKIFVDWLDANGVYVQTSSEWGRAAHPLVISSNTEDDGESCGRGILGRESIGEGELLMTIPIDLCLNRANAQKILGKTVVPDLMDEYIAIALLLMTEKVKGKESRWKPYFDVLPKTQDVYSTFVWTDEELEMLKGSPTFAASISLRNKVEREYKETVNTVFLRNKALFPSDVYTFELFQWAFVMLFSRAARLTSKLQGEELALVPYADLMNHNPYSNTYIDSQRSGMPFLSQKEEVALYADRPYKQFEQVFINYGEKGNGDLMLLYGFSLERNPFNTVDIAVGLSKEDPLYSQKKMYLEKSGRGELSVLFPLRDDRYPSELVDFLRLLLVESDDVGVQQFEYINFNEPITPSLERRVLLTIINICETYLNQYPTSVTQDEQLMADRSLFKSLTRFQRMAIKLRASEKRILARTITAVEEELVKLPSVSDAGGRIQPAGRSFDTRAKETTVANAKSPAAWVTFKDQERKEKEEAEGNTASSAVARRRRRRGGTD